MIHYASYAESNKHLNRSFKNSRENLVQKLEDKDSEIKMIVNNEVLQLVNEQRHK